jgi:hypothetical protein
MNIVMPEPSLSKPSSFANTEHYFSWCDLQERFFRDRVNRNRKTAAVNAKLAKWHLENPDSNVVNLAVLRIQRGLRAGHGRG